MSQQEENNAVIITDYPCTLYVALSEPCRRFDLVNSKTGRLEYFRYLNGKVARFKFNIPKPGTYYANTAVQVVKCVPVEIDERVLAITLPPPERDRWKDTEVVYNANLTGTPAANYTDDGVVEINDQFRAFPPPVRLFILLHEMGHYFYCTEEYCDLYAYVNFLRMGHNRSMAYYALDKVLSRTPENAARMDYLLSQIQATTGEFSPE